MIEAQDALRSNASSPTRRNSKSRRKGHRRRLVIALAALGGTSLIAVAGVAWLGSKASEINFQLSSATNLVPSLKAEIAADNPGGAAATVDSIRSHTGAAKHAADDPLWTLASTLPGVGSNFSAVAEVARSADDVSNLGLAPLVKVYSSLNWEALLPSSSGTDLEPLKAASPSISAAAHAIRLSADRLSQIDATELVPQVADPLIGARDQLQELTGTLDTAADAATLVPGMLGEDGPRNYLLMIQNNAEVRSSGGIPGALAMLTVANGKMTLGEQTSAAAIGRFSPPIPLDSAQEQIYPGGMGEFMQDVNLTPDFPTAASTARSMWEQHSGKQLDGVLSVDPVALSYVLDATGPVEVLGSDLRDSGVGSLPAKLSGANVVETLLSRVYEEIQDPTVQDAYFAGAAQEIFHGISSGNVNAKKLVAGLTHGVNEGRIRLWSERAGEQAILAKYPLGGSISGPSISPAQFGVYFNDGTGAKMDYYVKRTAQLINQCEANGYREVTVRVTSTNTAPLDAGTSLPKYVTGNGVYGVTPGTVQTNVVVYGPVQSNVTTALMDGAPKAFAAQRHNGRPVGTVTTRLAPGASSTVEFTFTKIVQNSEPVLDVTPTVQPVTDVILDPQRGGCNSAK